MRLLEVMGTPEIKVITGVRRSGKSKLLEQFIHHVQQDKNNNVIHLNLTEMEAAPFRRAETLYAHIQDCFNPRKNNIVCIDEIQLCKGFEWAVNGLHQKETYDIYITGSNAFLSGNDLATLFTGRTITIEIFPFSFAEFMKYFELTDPYTALESYIEIGGMAGSYLYRNPQDRIRYLKEVYNTLIVRDIQDKFKIKNTALLDNLTCFLSDNIGNETSVRKITKSLPTQENQINNVTIGNYLSYLSNAFLFYKIPRYDIAGRKYLSTREKYYISDHALRIAKIGRKNENSTTYIEIERNLGYGEFGTADGCSDLNYETGYEKMHTTGDALLIDIYMNKLLELCSNQGIKTQVLIPPMNESSVNALNPSYLQSINSYFEDLILKYPSIDINPEIPCYEDIYFGDASHLNNKGAIKFTTEYIQNN